MKLIDITGLRFGRLTVVHKLPPRPSKSGGSDWRCRCDCGKEFTAISSNIRIGHTTSCGCAAMESAREMGSNREWIAKRAARITRHGHKKRSGMSLEYRTWLGIKKRCYNPANVDFHEYGARGIRVCDRWRTSFEAFYADMGPRPTPLHSIDRRDPFGHYEPSNCRWASLAQQAGEHKRNTRVIELDGRRFENLKSACEYVGIGLTAVHYRIKSGYGVIEALTTPLRKLPNRRTTESYLPKSRRRSVV